MDTADASHAPGLRSLVDSIVTPALLGANAVVYLVLALHGEGWLTLDGHVVARFGSNYTPQTLGGEPWRLIGAGATRSGIETGRRGGLRRSPSARLADVATSASRSSLPAWPSRP